MPLISLLMRFAVAVIAVTLLVLSWENFVALKTNWVLLVCVVLSVIAVILVIAAVLLQ